MIITAHVAAESDRFHCDRCTWGRHCDDKNPAPFEKFVITMDGRDFLKSRTCLLPMITTQSQRFMRLHWHYRRQMLPHAGGVCDQPNLYIEAMEVLEKTFNQIEADRARQARERQSRDQHGQG